jgi:hypothetical protein
MARKTRFRVPVCKDSKLEIVAAPTTMIEIKQSIEIIEIN